MPDPHTTPLTGWHKEHGARMAPFAGWDMPIQYAGILAEHQHTRTQASVFDICHMGEFLVHGAGARNALARVVTHNLATLAPGRCRYGFLLTPQGGVKDDLIVYCLDEDRYMLVVNGACTDSDRAWIAGHLPADIALDDVSASTAKIDLQGPESLDVLEKTLGFSFRELKYFAHAQSAFQGAEVLVSRTGYTGELGYELYLAPEAALPLWEALLADARVEPAGLGARDTLRLEMGLPLYGHDLDEEHTPAEAGYSMMLKSEADYIGKGADREVRRKLVGLSLEGRRSARQHDAVLLPSGQEVGAVTSGSYCPSLGHAAALAYVDAAHAEEQAFGIRTARATLDARRADLPFYTGGTARMKL